MSTQNKFCLYIPPLSSIRSYMEMVDYAADHGIAYLETLNLLDLSTPDLEFARKLRAYADEKGISFPCVSVGLDLVGDDNRDAIETVKRYAEVARILGSPYLHHTIALNFSDPQLAAQNYDAFFARGIVAVREIFDYAASLGIRTIYEDQGFVFNGRDAFTRFLREVDREVGIVADFGNIQFVDENVEDFIPAFASRIVHVHVKDYLVTDGCAHPGAYCSRGGRYLEGCLVGEGSVHIEAAFKVLQAAGYRGVVSLEGDPMGPDEEKSFRKNLDTITDLLKIYLDEPASISF